LLAYIFILFCECDLLSAILLLGSKFWLFWIQKSVCWPFATAFFTSCDCKRKTWI